MLFEKTGSAVWMSHLDTMRLMQRAFRRAGVLLHHSQGFTPHAYVSILLPLGVGVSSRCEIMEYELDAPMEITPEQMNTVLPEGVRIIEVYESTRKCKELTHLKVELFLEYDAVPDASVIAQLFQRSELLVEKRTKRGIEEVDILPMIRELSVAQKDNGLAVNATICAQNPSLNPMLMVAAIERYLPQPKPNFVKVHRAEALDAEGNIFR